MAFDLKSFRKSLAYKGSFSAPQIQANLKQIAVQDKQAEKKRNIYVAIAIISGVLAFFSVIWVAESNGIAAIPIVLIAVAVVTGVLAGRWNRLDVPDLRYGLPPQLTEMLSRDMAKGSTFDTRIDFSKPTQKSKQTSKGPWPRRSGWTQTFFEDPWLWLSGKFLDSTRFTLTLTEITVVRSGYKRSRSGKRKHKTKTKPKGMIAELHLVFPRKRYGAVKMLSSELRGAINLPQDAALKRIKVDDRHLLLRVKVGPNRQDVGEFYQLITQMMLSAYQILNLSKELSKSST